MADFIDISDWKEKPWFGTKGTRNKSVVHNTQTGCDYYFKTSLYKPDKDYKHEFWSEIAASEIGRYLGFNTLHYDIAFNKTEIGCISEFMNTEGESELTEGIQYLTGYNSAYKPDTKESKTEYTFQFICEALESFDFNNYINEIIKIIIFDSLIGNSDRHQENWGIIAFNKAAVEKYRSLVKKGDINFFTNVFLRLNVWVMKNYPKLSSHWKIKFHHLMPNIFAPIYDSGSCLGREKLDENVKQSLKDEMQLSAYIRRGKSEIHWNHEKITHFQLIKNIMELYPNVVKTEIQRIRNIYNVEEISKIIYEIDKNLPPEKANYKLPEDRKKLMIKIVSLRFEELSKLLN